MKPIIYLNPWTAVTESDEPVPEEKLMWLLDSRGFIYTGILFRNLENHNLYYLLATNVVRDPDIGWTYEDMIDTGKPINDITHFELIEGVVDQQG